MALNILTVKLEPSSWFKPEPDDVIFNKVFDLKTLPPGGYARVLFHSTSQQFSNFITEFKSKGLSYKLGCVGLVAVTAVVAWSRVRAWRENRDVRKEMDRLLRRRGSVSSSSRRTEPKCVVCMTASRDVIVVTCGHLCLCAGCAVSLPYPRKCPICRKKVKHFMPVFSP